MSNKRVCENGHYRDMTEEEMAVLNSMEDIPTEPSHEERIAELEEALSMLLSGVTA